MIILIPAYEPDEKLIDLVSSIRTEDPELRIVIVDDGSGPNYQKVFAQARRLGATVLGYPDNYGKGCALKTGFRFIADQLPGHEVVCADSDGQHTVPDILRVAERVRTSPAAMVLGTRAFTGDVPARSRFGNAATRLLFRLASGKSIHDTQTGLRGYPASMLGWLQTVRGDRYEYELNLLLQASSAGQLIETVDIATIYLAENESSHFRPVADSIRIYAPLLKFLLSSLAAFLLDTAALLLLSAVTGSLLLSVVGARAVSSLVNFTVNRSMVFDAGRERPVIQAAARYFGLVLALLAVNFGLIAAFTAFGVALFPAKLLAEALLLVVSYTVQQRFVFVRTILGRRNSTPGRTRADLVQSR